MKEFGLSNFMPPGVVTVKVLLLSIKKLQKLLKVSLTLQQSTHLMRKLIYKFRDTLQLSFSLMEKVLTTMEKEMPMELSTSCSNNSKK